METGLLTTYSDRESQEAWMQAQGWYRDPYLVHEDRYFSVGQPTKLVRDGGIEQYDPPPAGPPKAELAGVPHTEPTYGSDLRRADDPSAGYSSKCAFWAVLDSVAVYGPVA